MQLSRGHPLPTQGLLYPLMVIAAIAVIAFSIVGIATISGWMPSAMVGSASAVSAAPQTGVAYNKPAEARDDARPAPAFQCAECGVIDSIRQIERRDPLSSAEPASTTRRTSAVAGPAY